MKQKTPPDRLSDNNPNQLPAPTRQKGTATGPSTRPKTRKGTRWTTKKMADFLRELAGTNNVSAAAKSVGMSRQSAYDLRARFKGTPFDIGWEAAFLHGYDNLAQAALERALHGVEVPHYYKGELVGTSRKFDERLTMGMMAMRNRYGASLLPRYGAAAEFQGEHWDALLGRIEDGRLEWELDDKAESDEEKIIALAQKYAPEEGNGTGKRAKE